MGVQRKQCTFYGPEDYVLISQGKRHIKKLTSNISNEH